jgi:HEAT repeat protein
LTPWALGLALCALAPLQAPGGRPFPEDSVLSRDDEIRQGRSMLRDPRPFVQMLGAALLAQPGYGTSEDVPALKAALASPDVELRLAASEALFRITEDSLHLVAVERLLKAKESETRILAATSLVRAGRNQPAVSVLLREVADGDVFIHRKVAMGLRELSAPTAPGLAQLSAFLEHPDDFVRMWAAGALGRQGSPQKAIAVLKALVRESDPTRLQAAGMLIELGEGKTGLPVLLAALKEGDLERRRAAVMALGGAGPMAKDAIPVLEVLLSDPPIARSTAQALRKIRGR